MIRHLHSNVGGIRSMPTFDSGSIYRALMASDRPEAILVRTHIQDAMLGQANAAFGGRPLASCPLRL